MLFYFYLLVNHSFIVFKMFLLHKPGSIGFTFKGKKGGVRARETNFMFHGIREVELLPACLAAKLVHVARRYPKKQRRTSAAHCGGTAVTCRGHVTIVGTFSLEFSLAGSHIIPPLILLLTLLTRFHSPVSSMCVT